SLLWGRTPEDTEQTVRKRTLLPCPDRFGACHSEERSDEESRHGRNNMRFFAFTTFRLRMTAHTFSVDTALLISPHIMRAQNSLSRALQPAERSASCSRRQCTIARLLPCSTVLHSVIASCAQGSCAKVCKRALQASERSAS